MRNKRVFPCHNVNFIEDKIKYEKCHHVYVPIFAKIGEINGDLHTLICLQRFIFWNDSYNIINYMPCTNEHWGYYRFVIVPNSVWG